MEWLIELKDNIDKHGVRWGVIFTLYAIFRREHRNHLLDLRDQRYENYFLAGLENQRIIMEKLGVGEKWSSGQWIGLQPTAHRLLKTLFLLLRKAIKLVFRPRRKKKMEFLRSNISKKLLALLVGVAVTALNKKFGLELSETDVYVLLGTIVTYIIGQSHIDGKRAISVAATSISQVVQTSFIPNQPDVSQLSYSDMVPYIREVNATLMKCYEDMKSGKVTDATKDAMDIYLSVHGLLESKKPPESLPSGE